MKNPKLIRPLERQILIYTAAVVRPDILSWHEIGDPHAEGLVQHVADFKTYLGNKGITSIKGFSINEAIGATTLRPVPCFRCCWCS